MTSLVVQWLRIHLAIQGMQIPSLGWETKIPYTEEQLSPCTTVEKPCALQSLKPTSSRTGTTQLESPRAATTEPVSHNQRVCALQ